MANTVVLGDLEKLNRRNCILIAGSSTQYVDIPSDPNLVTVRMETDNTANTMYMGNGAFAERGYVIFREHINTYNSSGILAQHSITPIPTGEVEITVQKTSSTLTVAINGDNVIAGVPYVPITTGQLRLCNYKYPETFYSLGCCITKVETDSYSYINDGDFGSTTLPSLPAGNDGAINGGQWWKTDVDQNFATPQLYKDTLVSPLTEDQKVIYTDATPFYGSNDPFWDPYNQDPTYSFTVAQQSLGGRVRSYNYSFSYEY